MRAYVEKTLKVYQNKKTSLANRMLNFRKKLFLTGK
jgi:hypothetical protein